MAKQDLYKNTGINWKAMKEILENQGYAESAAGSPRAILKTGSKL